MGEKWNAQVQQSISIIIVIPARAGKQIAWLDHGWLKVKEIHTQTCFLFADKSQGSTNLF